MYISTLSYFGTERGPDHPHVDSRTFSSFISAQKIMCLFFGQVPWTHDGYLSQDDATSHSGDQRWWGKNGVWLIFKQNCVDYSFVLNQP